MACRNPSASQEFARLEDSADQSTPAEGPPQPQVAREELKALFRELVGLLDSLQAEEGAHEAASDIAMRVRVARLALEKSLASHGLLSAPATVVSASHSRGDSIRATKRFIASSGGASQKATLMFGKR